MVPGVHADINIGRRTELCARRPQQPLEVGRVQVRVVIHLTDEGCMSHRRTGVEQPPREREERSTHTGLVVWNVGH